MALFQAVGQDLVDSEAVLEAVNQEAILLLQELRQGGEGLVDMLGFEEQLRMVNEKWNQAKFKVHIKQDLRFLSFYYILVSFSTWFSFWLH